MEHNKGEVDFLSPNLADLNDHTDASYANAKLEDNDSLLASTRAQYEANDFINEQWTDLLIKAAHEEKYFEALKLALETGVNPDASHPSHNTPLYNACSSGSLKNAALLLKFNADVNLAAGRDKETPLMGAIEGGHLPLIELLLAHPKIDSNMQNTRGYTALMIAAETNFLKDQQSPKKDFREKVILALLHAGAKPHIKNEENKTAIDIARKNGFDDLALAMERYRPTLKNLCRRCIKKNI